MTDKPNNRQSNHCPTARMVAACMVFLVAPGLRHARGEAPQEETGYVLTLEYPESVGDVYRIEGEAGCVNDRHGWAKEKDLGQTQRRTSVGVSGTMTVLALSKNQRASKVKIRLDALKETVDGNVVIEAKAGDELILERKDVEGNSLVHTATLNGRTLDAQQASLIAMVVDLVSPGDNSSADRLYGMTGKKKPGESWPVDTKAWVEALPGAAERPAKTTGTVKFPKVVEEKGERFGLLQFDVTCTGFIRPVPGEHIISKEVRTSSLAHVPLSGKRGTFFSETEQVSKVVSDNPMSTDGTPWVLHLDATSTFHQSLRETFLPK